jgi:uncharacterized membrane protein YhaH (DUF805 family)
LEFEPILPVLIKPLAAMNVNGPLTPEAQAHPMAVLRSPLAVLPLLFSPKGSIGRLAFCGGAATLAILSIAFDGAITLLADSAGVLPFLYALLVAWSSGCLSRKRLHDLGWSGIVIVFFLAFYIALVLAAPFLPLVLSAGSWPAAFAMVALIGGPAIGWMAWLCIIPGAAAAGTRPSPLPVVLT